MQVRLAHRNRCPVGAMYLVYQIEWFQSKRQGNVTRLTADLLGRLSPILLPVLQWRAVSPVDLPQKPIPTASAGSPRAAIERWEEEWIWCTLDLGHDDYTSGAKAYDRDLGLAERIPRCGSSFLLGVGSCWRDIVCRAFHGANDVWLLEINLHTIATSRHQTWDSVGLLQQEYSIERMTRDPSLEAFFRATSMCCSRPTVIWRSL
jgi:hypothetical protein